jgi:RecA-family ATPase
MTTLIKKALAVAKHYPVFPTIDKMPSWSNKELGVNKGEGGYKIATQDPDRVVELFSHPRAKEIAVPMGAMSGLLCVDVDSYKSSDNDIVNWMMKNEKYFTKTLTHTTRSGGYHIFFKHPGDTIRFPATLRSGVDLKAAGNGYVCWPGTDGYTVLHKYTAKSFPMQLLEEAMKAKGGTGNTTLGSPGSYNSASDDQLVEAIQSGADLYPALRTLSYRLATRGDMDAHDQVVTLEAIMDSSAASEPGHDRYDDWDDRRSKIGDLVESANRKIDAPVMADEAIRMLAETKSFVDTQALIAAGTRPIGPQRETHADDIEALVEDVAGDFETVSAKSLAAETLAPIQWIVPGMVPSQGTISLGGTSNVGKTRWLAALAALGAAKSLHLMGLPPAPSFPTLWMANEERVDDIKRRIKATFLQHGISTSDQISIRGKDAGMLRLVAINDVGSPEIDEANIAVVVSEARRIKAKVIFFDPYVTLSDAMDENSATSAAILTKAFLLITELTGAAVIHAHHTPKSRSEDNDWYRGSSDAWRGSGAIYSALDCGYTLSHWMPKGKDSRKAWKANYIDQNLSRWIVLDTGKIREGRPLAPCIYELVGQDMARGEGDQIGVCRLSSEAEADDVLTYAAVAHLDAGDVAAAMVQVLGDGECPPQAAHKKMRGHKFWKWSGEKMQPREIEELHHMIGTPVVVDGVSVHLKLDETKRTKGKWIVSLNYLT